MWKAATLPLLTRMNGIMCRRSLPGGKHWAEPTVERAFFQPSWSVRTATASSGHSTDRYRRTIWQCNSKFKVEERCHTPTVNTETVQRLFTQAYNRMMENREQIIKDCETMRRALTDFAALDAEIERQLEETQVVAELVKAAVKENASTAQSQEAYLRKYEALTERYEKAAAELERLQNLRTTQSQQDKAMALYIRTLKKQPVVLREWSDTIWTVMVEKAIVHRNGAITFVFKNGTEVKVGE